MHNSVTKLCLMITGIPRQRSRQPPISSLEEDGGEFHKISFKALVRAEGLNIFFFDIFFFDASSLLLLLHKLSIE